MLSIFTGDELGSLKHVQYSKAENEWKASSKTLLQVNPTNKSKAIQKLATFKQQDSETLVALARADGSSSVLSINEEGPEVVSEWKESRLRDGQRFVGLAATTQGVYSCTSNGALRLMKPGEDGEASSQLAALPMRLAEWRLSPNNSTFAYAGDEVELSVWDVQAAFTPRPKETADHTSQSSKKRKRVDQLLPGEVWRAKNVPNDSLNLRQPVRNTALAFLDSASSSNSNILVGTQLGDVRRYDTRAARRPVSNWTGIGKVGGVGLVEKGSTEHQVFVADCGCNLSALDLRNGKVSYSYKGISGSITSIAVSPSLLVSGSKDRFLRLHSTYPPPNEPSQQQESKGEVLDKLYVNVIPSVVALDVNETSNSQHEEQGEDADERDDDNVDQVWEEMEEVESDEEDREKKVPRKHKKKTRTA